MFGNGVLNLGMAYAKLKAASAVELGSGGIGTQLALYGSFSGSGNLATGQIQIVGAFMPNAVPWQQAAKISAAVSSIAGVTTLLATHGNIDAAASKARWEGFFLFGLKGGLGNSINPITAAGTANSAAKEATSGGAKKPDC